MNPNDDPAPLEPRTLFHAAAIAFAGRIRRPSELTIPARVSVALPPTGGEASSKGDYGRTGDPWADNLKIESASATVKGDFSDLERARQFTNGNHAANDLATASSARVSLKGVTLVNAGPSSRVVLEAAEISGQLDSACENGEPLFALTPPVFTGLKIGGDEVMLTIDTAPFNREGASRAGLARVFSADPTKLKRHLFRPPKPGATGDSLTEFETADQICCSLVTEIRWRGKTVTGNRLVVPDFGQIYFCEFQVNRWARRLTLMRIHLGSPDGGEFALGDVQTDGHRIPP
jgi:hypothetical protein